MFFKLFWSLLKEKYDFFSPSWTGRCYTVVQPKGKFYIFSALWRPSIAQKNSGKALQPVTSGGAAMKSFSLFLGLGSTEHSLVCSSQWQWSLCTLNCFDQCCLPSVWKSFLCKQHKNAKMNIYSSCHCSVRRAYPHQHVCCWLQISSGIISFREEALAWWQRGWILPALYGYKQTWVNKRQLLTHLHVGPQSPKNKNLLFFTAPWLRCASISCLFASCSSCGISCHFLILISLFILLIQICLRYFPPCVHI